MSWDVSTHWGILNTHDALLIIIIITIIAVENLGAFNLSTLEFTCDRGHKL